MDRFVVLILCLSLDGSSLFACFLLLFVVGSVKAMIAQYITCCRNILWVLVIPQRILARQTCDQSSILQSVGVFDEKVGHVHTLGLLGQLPDYVCI